MDLPIIDVEKDSFNIQSVWQIITDIGSISGFIVLIYTVFQSLQKKPKFKFDFVGQSGLPSHKDNVDYFTFNFQGQLKNQSLDPNSISKIFLVVWKNRKKNETLRFGYGGVTIKKQSSDKMLSLPITFAPRESLALEIKCEFPMTGTSDSKLLSEFIPVQLGSQYLLPKYKYELAFEDINENLYDHEGRLCNREEIDLRWTLQNSIKKIGEGEYWPFVKHKGKIFLSRIKFQWKIFLQSFGLWK